MQLSLNDDYIQPWFPYHLFQQWIHEDGSRYRFLTSDSWALSPDAKLEPVVAALDGRVLAKVSDRNKVESLLVKLEDEILVCLRHHRANSVLVDIAAESDASVEKVLAAIRKALPTVKPKKDDRARILVNFATVKQLYARTLDAAKWQDVEWNYPTDVRQQLDQFMDPKFRPSSSGQLLLWHGLPGTGKTWALRALGYEWRNWADMVYIVDPDVFFGDSVYMMSTLMQPSASSYDEDDEEALPGGDQPRLKGRERWRLLVAEDTGELLAADAKNRTGQGLSRLLNIVDGMIGQGLRVMVLITTNELLGTLHPAVTRPGRAAGIIEFGAFSPEEANQWLIARGRETRKSAKPITLAELYNHKEKSPERKVGFAA